jgi:hypothetical protein
VILRNKAIKFIKDENSSNIALEVWLITVAVPLIGSCGAFEGIKSKALNSTSPSAVKWLQPIGLSSPKS